MNRRLIKNLDFSIKVKNILTALGVYTLKDLHTMYILGTIPEVGTRVNHIPYTKDFMIWSEEINNEVKTILKNHCLIFEPLEHVGRI